MNTKQIIKSTIDEFNSRYNNQVNLSSDAAVEELTRLIVDAIANPVEGTYNEQQMHLFTNIEQEEHK